MTAGIQASDSPTKEPLRQQTFALKSSRRLPCTSMKTKSKFWATKKLNFITPISRNVEKFSLNSLELDRRQGVHVLSMIWISLSFLTTLKALFIHDKMAWHILYYTLEFPPCFQLFLLASSERISQVKVLSEWLEIARAPRFCPRIFKETLLKFGASCIMRRRVCNRRACQDD